jgi:EAL domain-containing protein (putative c-di-GMP-specific phosphodiesterase class I)/CheY-like chemotaxis protein
LIVGGVMNTEKSEQSPIFPSFGRRKVRPRVCIVDRKHHIRAFLRDTLEDLDFITCECSGERELVGKLEAHFPNLVVLGLSAGGEESAEVLKTLAARQFAGQILLLGPGGSPMLSALQEFGGKLGLAMLPVLSTPFGSQTLRASVAALLPQAVPQPPIDLAEAMSAGWLELWYQPKVDTHTLAVKGAEALIRIRHPNWGIVTPAYFIPDDGDPQFRALAEFTIEQSIQDWHDFVAESGPIEIAINLPLGFLEDHDSIREFCLKMPDHPAFEGLLVEINGVEVIRNLEHAKAAARQLRFHNIGISIDDLGAEWPSLMSIQDFPFIEIKVDRKFVTGCADDRLKKTVCRRILELADDYGARTVAEGVETTSDLLAVRELGFDLAQGFLFAKPTGAKKFVQTVLRRCRAV